MQLIENGEPEKYAALMSDVMRRYLAQRVPEIEASQTSSEIVAASHRISAQAAGLGDLLWRSDLVKFAAQRIDADEARRIGEEARGVVNRVEEHFRLEEEDSEKKAA
jgi:hypothetical protein